VLLFASSLPILQLQHSRRIVTHIYKISSAFLFYVAQLI
jgi:hypothetical protein